MKEYREMSRRTIVLILIGIILVAAGVRLYGLDKQSLWYDEVAEVTAFQRSFLHDYHGKKPASPPLNSFFIYPITQLFPRNDLALRMVPFIFGLISVPLLYLLGREFFNDKVGLFASFLLAILPLHIWYSQDIRMYALLWMLTLVSLIYFLRSLRQPRLKNYVGYTLSTIASLYTLQFAVFTLVAQGVYLLFFFRKYKDQLFRWLSIFIVVVLLYLPWLISNLKVMKEEVGGFQKQTNLLIAIGYAFYSYVAGFSIGPSLRELHLDHSLTVIKPYVEVIVLMMILYGVLFILGVCSLRKNYNKLLFLLFLLIIPSIGMFIVSKIKPNFFYNVRYTGTALFAFLLFIASAIEWLSNLRHRVIAMFFSIFVIIAIIGVSSYSYFNYQFNKKYAKPDIRGAVVYIKQKRVAGDDILCIVDSVTFSRYSRDNFWCQGLSVAEFNDKDRIEVKLERLVKMKRRLWLVLSHEWYGDKRGYAKAWLDKNYVEIEELRKGLTEIANVRIYCYDLTKKKKSILVLTED